jgi:hypothetical protein
MVANLTFCIIASANELPFPSCDLTIPFPQPTWYLSALHLFTSPYYLDFEANGVSRPYAEVLHNIRILAATYQQASDCTDSAHYLSVLSFLCANIQRVMSLPPLPLNQNGGRTKMYLIAESVRAALILHVFHLWVSRFAPDPILLVNNARQNLKSSLKPLLDAGETNELLLWFACVGAVGSSVGSAERRWFTGHVVVLVEGLGVGGFGELRERLRRVIWHEVQDRAEHERLWGEVVDMMG